MKEELIDILIKNKEIFNNMVKEGDLVKLDKWDFGRDMSQQIYDRFKFYPGVTGRIDKIENDPINNSVCRSPANFESYANIYINHKLANNLYQTSKINYTFFRKYFSVLSPEKEKRDIKINGLINDTLEIDTKVKEKLDEYLEFDSDELFDNGDLIRIFGGAIRDSIADQPINDVDILVGSSSYIRLKKFIELKGYKFVPDFVSMDISAIYNDIAIINEPHTYMKGDKKIQFIRPVVGSSLTKDVSDLEFYKEGFKRLISEVDLSCCGVSYDGLNVNEDYKDAILHCKNKVFIADKDTAMYHHKRVKNRIAKMISRGWSQIKKEDAVKYRRKFKIEELI
jgi:hypothetical protein